MGRGRDESPCSHCAPVPPASASKLPLVLDFLLSGLAEYPRPLMWPLASFALSEPFCLEPKIIPAGDYFTRQEFTRRETGLYFVLPKCIF